MRCSLSDRRAYYNWPGSSEDKICIIPLASVPGCKALIMLECWSLQKVVIAEASIIFNWRVTRLTEIFFKFHPNWQTTITTAEVWPTFLRLHQCNAQKCALISIIDQLLCKEIWLCLKTGRRIFLSRSVGKSIKFRHSVTQRNSTEVIRKSFQKVGFRHRRDF